MKTYQESLDLAGRTPTTRNRYFGRFERPNPDHRPAPPVWQPVTAVIAACAGLGLLAALGVSDEEGLNGVALALPFAAAIAGGVGGARRWERKRRERGEPRPTTPV